MKRSTFDGRITVFRYGAPAHVDIPETAMDQLRQANRLWNDLVEIHCRHEERVAAAWATRPEVAVSLDRLARVDARREEVAAAIGKAKSRARSRDGVPAPLKAEAKDLAAQRKEAKADVRACKDAAYDALKPVFTHLLGERNAAVKATYATHVQQAGLYWATYNAVVQNFDSAVRRLADRRKAGQPAEMRFHRFTGEGTWTVQLQRESGGPPRTWDTLASGESKWRGFVRIDEETLPHPSRRTRPRTLISIRIGSTPDRQPVWFTVPVTLHRPIPADADITQVQITRVRVGTQYRLSVAFTARRPHVTPANRPGVVAVDLGWRRRPDGGIRVAVWRGIHPQPTPAAPVPDWAAEWARSGPNGGELVIPASWLDEMTRLRDIQSLRDSKLDRIKTDLVGWFRDHPAAAAALDVTATDIDRWRSANRFAALIRRWRDTRQDGDETMFAVAEAWRVQDRHLLEWVAHTTDQLTARRREVYRVFAAHLTATYGHLIVEDMVIPQITRREHRVEEADDYQTDIARGNARAAAPGLLRQTLETAAGAAGVAVTKAPSAGTTRVHADCDTWITGDLSAEITVWCPTCQTSYDQDANAAVNLIRLATGETGPFTPPMRAVA